MACRETPGRPDALAIAEDARSGRGCPWEAARSHIGVVGQVHRLLGGGKPAEEPGTLFPVGFPAEKWTEGIIVMDLDYKSF